MTRTKWLLLVALPLAAVAAAFGAAVIVGKLGTQVEFDATLLVAIVAALGALAAVIVTVVGNAGSSRELKGLSTQQGEMAKDIRQLASLTQASIEEARAQRADPSVLFLIGDEGAASEVWTRRRLERKIDIEAIVEGARAAALASLPHAPREKEMGGAVGAFLANGPLLRSFLGDTGPPTAEERAEFDKEVIGFDKRLRTWLADCESWWNEAPKVFVGHFRFENTGRIPAEGIRVHLFFPNDCSAADELPSLKDQPVPPKFHRESLADLFGAGFPGSFAYSPLLGRGGLPDASRHNVSGPSYTKGSVKVEFRIDKLLHGISEDTRRPALVRIPEDGDLEIPWEIHGENLAEPIKGLLRLTVETEAIAGPPITSLAELVALRKPIHAAEDDAD
jgi:hypothetical protein